MPLRLPWSVVHPSQGGNANKQAIAAWLNHLQSGGPREKHACVRIAAGTWERAQDERRAAVAAAAAPGLLGASLSRCPTAAAITRAQVATSRQTPQTPRPATTADSTPPASPPPPPSPTSPSDSGEANPNYFIPSFADDVDLTSLLDIDINRHVRAVARQLRSVRSALCDILAGDASL